MLLLGLLACLAPASVPPAPVPPAVVPDASPDDGPPPDDDRPTDPADDVPHDAGDLPPASLGLTYELYVRSFQDTDGDGVGDLAGVRARLDHLESLGVDTIWLMPLFPAVGPAGYDVTDHDRVREELGDAADLRALTTDAHARGMQVILDLPLNHVARTHPWFAAAEADPQAPERGAFLFADTQWDDLRWFPAAGGGWYYGFFGAELPDVNWADAGARARLEGVFARWLGRVDGYRLDAVPMLVEADGAITGTDATHALLADLYRLARATNPDAVVLAEASEEDPAENARYLGTPEAPEADRVIDFPRRRAMLDAITAGDPAPLRAVLHAQAELGALGRTAPYLSSHDRSRLATYVPDARARRVLQVIELLLPGDPILYYGEELDLADATSGTGQDEAWRAPMPWDASSQGGFTTGTPWFTPDPGYATGQSVAGQDADPHSPLNLVRDLACVRADLDGAGWEELGTDTGAVFAFVRDTDDGRVVVVANLGPDAVGPIRVDARGAFRDLTDGGAGVDAGDGLRLPGLGAWGYAILGDELAGECRVEG